MLVKGTLEDHWFALVKMESLEFQELSLGVLDAQLKAFQESIPMLGNMFHGLMM